MSIRRRLEVLEGNMQPEPEDRSEIRKWMRESLSYIAELRRSDTPEAKAELEAFREDMERQIARRRGEGSR